jgi:hypothetical protein
MGCGRSDRSPTRSVVGGWADAEAQVFLGGLESKLIAAETAGATAGGLALGRG